MPPKKRTLSQEGEEERDVEECEEQKQENKKMRTLFQEDEEVSDEEQNQNPEPSPKERIELLLMKEEYISKCKRECFYPQTEGGVNESKTHTANSKFGGQPYFTKDDVWPVCGNCSNPMQFLLQIDFGTCPDSVSEKFGPGLLQLFVCQQDCDTYEPFNNASFVRIIPPQDYSEDKKSNIIKPPEKSDPIELKRIVGWTKLDDWPSNQELGEIGEKISEDEEMELAYDDLDYCHNDDKLSGWPRWVQGVEYPSCSTCGGDMTNMIFQLNSETENHGWIIGDAGTAHITQCPKHKEVVTLNWACC